MGSGPSRPQMPLSQKFHAFQTSKSSMFPPSSYDVSVIVKSSQPILMMTANGESCPSISPSTLNSFRRSLCGHQSGRSLLLRELGEYQSLCFSLHHHPSTISPSILTIHSHNPSSRLQIHLLTLNHQRDHRIASSPFASKPNHTHPRRIPPSDLILTFVVVVVVVVVVSTISIHSSSHALCVASGAPESIVRL